MGSDDPAAAPLLDSVIMNILYTKICMIYNTIRRVIPIYIQIQNNDEDWTFTFEIILNIMLIDYNYEVKIL